MTLWTTKKTGAAGQLPAENQAPHGMKYPPRMLRPATSIFTCAIFMLAVDPNHLAVMEDDEHVFLFTNIYIYNYIYHYISIYQISGSLPRVPGTLFHLHLSQSEKQHWTNKGENGISPPNLQHQYATWPRLQAKSQQTMESAVCRRHSGVFFVRGMQQAWFPVFASLCILSHVITLIILNAAEQFRHLNKIKKYRKLRQ